ncbi:MAG: PadR family transcriptional regulator [Sphingomicrobium sp.]
MSRAHSPQTLSLFAALTERPQDWHYGLELARTTGLASGTLYPILIRLADRGYLLSEWREPQRPGRPQRHVYRLTPAGLAAVEQALSPPMPAAAVAVGAAT